MILGLHLSLVQGGRNAEWRWASHRLRLYGPKVLGSDRIIICIYLPLWVYPMFSMRVYSLFRFLLIN